MDTWLDFAHSTQCMAASPILPAGKSSSQSVHDIHVFWRPRAGQQGVLLDILEVPQFMDICVRNGNYDDALDLRAFVAKLALIHPHLQVCAA